MCWCARCENAVVDERRGLDSSRARSHILFGGGGGRGGGGGAEKKDLQRYLHTTDMTVGQQTILASDEPSFGTI